MAQTLTIEFVPYFEIDKLDSSKRIERLLKSVRQDKIVLLEGRLKKTEESDLIARTMSMIDDSFKGIELAVIHPQAQDAHHILEKFKKNIVNLLLGDRQGFTIIGPANIVKEIKKDPGKIQLLTQQARAAPKKKSKKKKR